MKNIYETSNPWQGLMKVSCPAPHWAVCLFEAHLAPERTKGSLCLAFTAAQLYQHHPPPARAGDGPGNRQLLPPGAHLQEERADGEEGHGAPAGERRQDRSASLPSEQVWVRVGKGLPAESGGWEMASPDLCFIKGKVEAQRGAGKASQPSAELDAKQFSCLWSRALL